MESLAQRLASIEARIQAACARVERARAEVKLVPASKFQPLERMREAIAAGLDCFGENRVQEAVAKAAVLPGLEWHLLGPLQSNKVRAALGVFRVLHALDRPSIVAAVDREATARGQLVEAFVEVNLAGEASKHGWSPGELLDSSGQIEVLESVRLVGLMAIPPPESDPRRARAWFTELARLRDRVGQRCSWPGFRGDLSMGMSEDFELAIEEGATHIRVGTALFGPRA